MTILHILQEQFINDYEINTTFMIRNKINHLFIEEINDNNFEGIRALTDNLLKSNDVFVLITLRFNLYNHHKDSIEARCVIIDDLTNIQTIINKYKNKFND